MWGWPVPAAMKDNHVAMGMLQMLLTIIIMVINQKFFCERFYQPAPRRHQIWIHWWHSAPEHRLDTVRMPCFAMTGAQVRGDMDAVMGYVHEFYFESAAMILTLITVGKMLESHAKAGQPMP